MVKTILYFQCSVSASNMRELDGVRRYAEDAGWRLEVIEYGGAARSRLQKSVVERADMKRLLSFWKPAGCIIDCGGNPPCFGKSDFGRIPHVYLDCQPCDAGKGGFCVCHDEEVVGRAIAKELLSLGFDDYACIPRPEKHLAWNRIRCRAFRDCILENGKRVRTFRHTSRQMDKVRLIHEIADWLGNLPRPCGVFTANDTVGSVFLEVATRAGFDIPKDFAVVSVDNDAMLCEGGAVSMTSVETSSQRVGYAAAQLLDRCMGGRRSCSSVIVSEYCVHRRASTRRYVNADARVVKALEFIRKRACDGISPPDVVSHMGCSRRLADLRFRETTGHTILEEIHSVRIDRVKELLRRGGVTTSFVADSAGYSSVIDMRRVFKRLTGTTIGEYSR